MEGVYLIHFDEPYMHARHYLGYSTNLDARLEAHRLGQGARLLEVVSDAGIGYTVVRVWEGADRNFERRLKKQKNSPRLCPVCRNGGDYAYGSIRRPDYGPRVGDTATSETASSRLGTYWSVTPQQAASTQA